MDSPRLVKLNASIKELRRLLLPGRFDPTGSYGQADKVRARALSFRVLGHAELESYFEDRAVEVATAALTAWKQHKHVSSITMHLLAFSGREMHSPPDTLEAPTDNKKKTWPEFIDISYRFERSVADFIRRVTKENHGIKERNIMSMMLPIGVHHSSCDQLLMTNLDQFGEARGLVAHNSTAAYVTQSVDPKDEYARLKSLVEDLRPLDQVLTGLLKTASGPP